MVNLALPMPHMGGKLIRMKPVIFTLAAVLATTTAVAAETIPKPKLRPQRAEQPVQVVIPIPRPRPLPGEERRTEVPPPAPQQAPAAGKWPAGSSGWPASAVKDARGRCESLLRGLDITYEPQAPLGSKGGCGTAAPVLVSEVAGVAVTPPAVLSCPMAASLSAWLTSSVKPAAKKRLKTDVTELHAAASYVCRRRNNARSGKLSEHGRANALDISGFSFAKSDSVAVGGGGWAAAF